MNKYKLFSEKSNKKGTAKKVLAAALTTGLAGAAGTAGYKLGEKHESQYTDPLAERVLDVEYENQKLEEENQALQDRLKNVATSDYLNGKMGSGLSKFLPQDQKSPVIHEDKYGIGLSKDNPFGKKILTPNEIAKKQVNDLIKKDNSPEEQNLEETQEEITSPLFSNYYNPQEKMLNELDETQRKLFSILLNE